MRKWQAIILVAIMFLGVTTSAFGATKELTLYWCCGQTDRLETWTAMGQAFEAETGIKVNVVRPAGTGSYYERVITALLAGSGPDVMWLGTGFWQLADGGLLLPLQDVVAKDATLKSIPPAIMANDYWMGNQLGIPYGLNINVLFYNKGLFDTAGVRMPESWTWDEMLNAATKISRDSDGDGNKDVWGFAFTDGDPHWWLSYGGSPYADSGRCMSIQNGPNVESLNIMADITTKGLVQPKVGTQSFTPKTFFTQNKLAMSVDGPYSLPTFAAMSNIDWNVSSFPDLKYNGKVIQFDMMTPESFAVNAQTKDKDAAIALLKFITSKDAMQAYAKMGNIVPTVSSAFQTFVTGDKKINRKVFLDAIPHLGSYIYSHPAYTGSLYPIQVKYRDLVFRGEISPVTALDQIETEMNTRLDEFWKNRSSK